MFRDSFDEDTLGAINPSYLINLRHYLEETLLQLEIPRKFLQEVGFYSLAFLTIASLIFRCYGCLLLVV